MTSRLPIIFFHRGYSPYLEFTLRQAKLSNPESRIILLGDKSNDRFKMVEHHLIDDFAVNAEKFSGVYRHMSSNPVAIELICFQRWYTILDLMKQLGLREFVTTDSDVLIYSDFTTVVASMQPTSFAIIAPEQNSEFQWLVSAGVSYWTVEALEAYCDYTLFLYEKDGQCLEQKWQYHQENDAPGGVCDMSTLHLFCQSTSFAYENLLDVHAGGVVDRNIVHGSNLRENEFLMQGDQKAITFRDGIPYGYNLDLQQEIMFHVLHFGGVKKASIPSHYQGDEWLLKPRLQLKLRRIAGQVYRRIRSI